MADIVIVNPRFDISFWGMEKCMEMLGKRANLPVACLPLLAALVPKHHDVTLIDENVEEIDFDRLGSCRHGVSHRHEHSRAAPARNSSRKFASRRSHGRRRRDGHGRAGRA